MARDAQAVQDRIVLAQLSDGEWSPIEACRRRCDARFNSDDTFDAAAAALVGMGFIERGKHNGTGTRMFRLTDLGKQRQQFLVRERQGALSYAR